MTKTEKIIWGLIAFFTFLFIINSVFIYKQVSDHGGIKQVVISIGKEVKSIGEEINSNVEEK